MKKNKKQIPGFMKAKGNKVFMTDNSGKEQHFGIPPNACPSCGQIDNTHAKGCFYCPEGREELFGVPPEELTQNISLFSKYKDSFTVYKSAKKGTNSFRITKSLLDSLFETYKTIQKKPILVITIVDGSDEYTITCQITKK